MTRHGLAVAAIVGICGFGVALAQSAQTLPRAAKPQLSSSGKFVIRKANIAAGDRGQGRTVITNHSRKPKTTITMTKLAPTGRPALTRHLSLSIHDDTTNRCYWPRRAKGRCRSMGPWKARLRGIVILSRMNTKTWAPRERHKFTITWSLAATAPNEVQGAPSKFVVTWRAK